MKPVFDANFILLILLILNNICNKINIKLFIFYLQ